LAVITFIILNPVILFSYGIELNVSWTFSALSHWFVLTLLLLPTLLLLRFEKSKVVNIVVKITIVLAVYGVYFAMNPIYQGDYSKKDEELSVSNNSLLSQVLQANPTFNGVVCIASPGCPHCKVATRYRLKPLKKRSDVDVAIFLAAKDSASLDYYIEETGASELDYFLVQDPEGMHELSRGSYPTFIYIKNGKIIHRWSNDNLGYPALDWIESGLN
jgi:hypothetical protein